MNVHSLICESIVELEGYVTKAVDQSVIAIGYGNAHKAIYLELHSGFVLKILAVLLISLYIL